MPNPTKKVQIVGEVLKNFVRHDIVQELTEEQKKQARDNIGSGDPQIQTDWNQNDKTAVDFIKNRTHYEIPDVWEKVEFTEPIIGDVSTTMFVSDEYAWSADKACRIRVDGVEYVFDGMTHKAIMNAFGGEEVYSIGAPYAALNSNINWAEYQFSFATADFTNIYAVFEDGTTDHAVELFISNGEIKQLDPKFIKDMYYEKEPVKTEIVPVSTIEFSGTLVENPFSIEVIEGATYLVIWDDMTYECIAYIPVVGGIAVGNAEVGGAGSGGNGEPFFCVLFDGGILLFASESGSHNIAITKVEQDIHKIPSKYVGTDWEQNDPDDIGYIANRTHYDSTKKVDISGATYIVDITDLVSQTEEAIPLEVGQIWNSYRLIRDTQEWEEYRTFEVKQAEDGSFYIGYPSLRDEDNATVIYLTANELTVPDGMRAQGYSAFKFTCVSGYVTQGEIKQLDEKYLSVLEEVYETVFEVDSFDHGSFVEVPSFERLIGKHRVTIDGVSEICEFIDEQEIGYSWYMGSTFYVETEDGGVYFEFFDGEPHSVRIEKIQNVVKGEYLPDEAKAQADWNQSDETATDYIKNKPFGEDYWDTVATITGTGNSDGSLTFEMTEPEWQSAICNIGTVIVYDENNYEIAEESVGTGNYFTLTGEGITISGRGVGTGFNWTLSLDNVSFTEGEEYTFSVLKYVELKQIDEKYIPDTIARVKDVNAAHPQMYLADQTTGFQYTIAIDNGSLVSAPRPFTYTIITEPTTTTYTAGEYFDATGLATAVVYDDDSIVEITDYHFPAEYLAEGTTEVAITATILGSEYSATTAVTVTALDPATYLANYTYTDNGDGTYTVTGWADTTKTDELTIPNNYFVKMGG